MARGIQAKSLAKALFEAALKYGEPVKRLSELRRVADLVKDSAVASMLQKPGVPFADKARVLAERAGGLGPQVLNLVAMMVEKGRLSDIDEISIEYQRLLDSYHGVEGAEIAEVTTAVSLDDADKLNLGKRLTDILGKPVVIKAAVDPSLVGGIRIRVGDKLIDGSLRYKLQSLHKELV